MKMMLYCQHVLGIGHFMRTLEICKALTGHDILLVTGGADVNVSVPDHVREFRLPGLMMDNRFEAFFTTASDRSVEAAMSERRLLLMDLFLKERPDLLMVELYPFGRKKFRFELDPILRGIRSGSLPKCRVVCSLRDILVEKTDAESYENRVLTILNRDFDGLLVHADPALVRLDETFSRADDITIPVLYTGFITARPTPGARERIRRTARIPEDARLIVASAGGGGVGAPLLQAVAEAFSRLDRNTFLHVFTGPFLDPETYRNLEARSDDRLKVASFTFDFLSWLAAADLSVSMAGYNTCMNLMAARVPSLVWPFARNREQRLRAERLTRFGGLGLLEAADLEPGRLARLMAGKLNAGERPDPRIDLNGAARTARWLTDRTA